ncbi:DUF4352 domain-containing protein [Streptomyces sp. NPDC048424]|uniref:DUF4352 domain-containing protein n=1 Tax=Streptomyces sp. NPDC048424 TaxID=3155265 RepID=UPI0034120DB9
MSTTPNPPSTPPGPPAEPAGTPMPEAASIPAPSAPAQPLSLDKTPAPAAPEPPETAEAPAQPLSLEKSPAAAAPESPAAPETPEAPADAGTPEAPAAADTPPAPTLADTAPAPADAPVTPATVPAPAPADPWATPDPSAPQAPAAPSTPQAPTAPADPAAFGTPGAPGPSSFAPPTPVPGPPTVPGGPAPAWGGPAPAWGQPGFGGVPYAGYPQGPPTTNGLAVAAVIVASFAVLVGLLPFFFWAGTLLAFVAIGLGIGGIVRAGKGAPNKTMSVVGTVLGVLGLAASGAGLYFTATVLDDGSSRYEHGIDIDEDELDLEGLYPSDEPWPSASPSPSQVPGLSSAVPFGETVTYPNGLKVSLSAPKKYVTKNKYSKVGNAVEMTLTITNGSSATHNVIYAMPNVRDANGMTAKLVFDGDVPKMIKGDILPGESASGVVAFEVPEGTERISADISPGILLPHAKFSGSVG